MPIEPIEKIKAREHGHRFFWTGKPCKRGHISARRTYNGMCVDCSQISTIKYINSEHGRKKIRTTSRLRRGLPTPTRPEPETCECCGRASTGKLSLHLDHNHINGKFRGWLCLQCNTGLGKLGDNISGVLRLLDYLKKAETD